MAAVTPEVRAFENLRFFAAETTTLAVGDHTSEHKIVQLKFSKRDGSVFVSFPYLEAGSGILSEAKFTSPPPGRVTASFGEAARTTSHLAKFSHHPDGRVLFSQDGRVLSEVRRQSFPLDGPIGHVFQLHAYEPRAFARLDDQRKTDRLYLRNVFTDDLPRAISVHAEWRRKKDVVATISPPGRPSGPRSDIIQRSTGAEFTAFFLGQPTGFPLQDHLLMLSVSAAPVLPERSSPGLIFLGGYDPHEQLSGAPPVQHTGCLIAFYPATGLEQLAERCKSVDLIPKSHLA